jgi:hypothetical protein
VGNFPQAFSHLALINSARIISGERRDGMPADGRPDAYAAPGVTR